MIYLIGYFVIGLVCLVGLLAYEIYHVEEFRWSKPGIIIRSCALVVCLWPWIVPFYFYEKYFQ